ncbi:MAG TPA: dihydrofolate reductase [Aestuariivirgaceae bacterium]|nr:dihydrofolate reductase [Aestuariivirgaceae bacterium]
MRPRVAFVVAVSKNGVIGLNGKLPWRLSSDLRFFKTITMGKPLIMGRKTWESLPKRPLPGRDNIVITRQRGYAAQGATVVSDAEAALSKAEMFARRAKSGEIAVIGGGEIFALLLPRADRVYLTEVDLEVEGDTNFPALDPAEWKEVGREKFPRGENDDAAFVVRTLDRRYR